MSQPQTMEPVSKVPPKSGARVTIALATLFVTTFVLGCAEMLVIGMLDLIAADLRISIPAAGLLLTAQAVGVAVGGPILTALTIKLNQRTVLVASLGVSIATSLVLLLTAEYGLFLAARLLAGAATGLAIATGCAIASSLVPAERKGRALAAVISGFAVSTAVGVPLGTLIGQTLGWRGSFTAVVALATIALIATLVVIPSVRGTGGGIGDQLRSAFAPRVLAVLGVGMLIFAAVGAFVTYLVPFLHSATGITGGPVSAFLLIYGVAAAVGAFSGGRFADAHAVRTLILGAGGVAVALAALRFFGGIPFLVALALVALGLCGAGLQASYQYRVVELAGSGGQLAQSLPASAANLGMAFGSVAGGLAIGALAVASAAAIAAMIIAIAAIAAAVITSVLKPPRPSGRR